ncbi:hypothetical protein EVAR_94667_1 [Eumeta japonica]|uniref:Uncharacterized protein n=1 Tax=Eumeta variegata TaxID=151549 RepID=A0A4C1UUY0_EUMVA|nr:hypothetical protein EVAR_94667_1 [Eumeta japonica]
MTGKRSTDPRSATIIISRGVLLRWSEIGENVTGARQLVTTSSETRDTRTLTSFTSAYKTARFCRLKQLKIFTNKHSRTPNTVKGDDWRGVTSRRTIFVN